MRKQLGILATLLCFSAFLLAGCNNQCSSNCAEPCRPVCEPVCQPKPCPPPCPPECPPPCPPKACSPCPPCPPKPCPPPCPPKPCPPPCPPKACPPPCAPKPCPPPCEEPCAPTCVKLKPCKHAPAGECSCNGVTVRAKNPKMCILGDQYPLDIEVSACIDVCKVVVSTTLPDGVTLVRSQPEAKVEGNKLTWNFGHIEKGQTLPGQIVLRCEREGDLCTCFCVEATPVAFCALLCAKPVLTCHKTAPAEVCPGDPIHYSITVSNVGTCTAEEVVITDVLPEGVQHPSCQKTLTFKLGCLEPCQSKKVEFCVTACKRGKITNTALVSACNANQSSCEATTCVCCCALECQKTGPKEVVIGQNADYQIVVSNTGDKPLHEVVVTDIAPSATSIVSAQGANICGKQAVWKLRELKPGEKVNFNVTLTTCNPGFFPNRANVTTCEGCTGSCEAGTTWKGRPALDFCIDVSDNPICVGETTRLKVIVSNKGQEYDSNVNVVVNLPAELVPVDVGGATTGQISGQTVTFAPFANLAPRQRAEYFVTVKANGRGDLRPKVQVSSDFIKNAITQEESIIVN